MLSMIAYGKPEHIIDHQHVKFSAHKAYELALLLSVPVKNAALR